MRSQKSQAFDRLSQNAQLHVGLEGKETLEEKLEFFILKNYWPGIRYCLAKGADTNKSFNSMVLALKDPKLLLLLLAYGANQNIQYSFGETLIHRVYFKYGYNMKFGDAHKETEKLKTALRILSQNGADFNIKNCAGKLPEDELNISIKDEKILAETKIELRLAIEEGKSLSHANKIDRSCGIMVSLQRLSCEALLEFWKKGEFEGVRLSDEQVKLLNGEVAFPLPLAHIKAQNELEQKDIDTLELPPLTEQDKRMISLYKEGKYMRMWRVSFEETMSAGAGAGAVGSVNDADVSYALALLTTDLDPIEGPILHERRL